MAAFTPIYNMTADRSHRDVSPFLWITLVKDPALRWLRWGSPFRPDQVRGYRWTETSLSETTFSSAAGYTAASGVLVLASTTGIEAGDRITVDGMVDAAGIQLTWNVNTVTNGTDLAVALLGGADTTFGAAARVAHITRGTADNSLAPTGTVPEPTIRVNNYQLFQAAVDVGDIAQASGLDGALWGFEEIDPLARGLMERAKDIAHRIYMAVRQGDRRDETSAAAPSMMEGWDRAINNTSGVKVMGGGGLISLDNIDDAIEEMMNRGMPPGGQLLLLANPKHTRAVSAERNDMVQYTTNGELQELGGNVQVYLSELSGYRVIVQPDPKLPVNTAYLLNLDYIELVPSTLGASIQGIHGMDVEMPPNMAMVPVGVNPPPGLAWMTDATTPGRLGQSKVLRVDLSTRCINRTSHHATIWNLA